MREWQKTSMIIVAMKCGTQLPAVNSIINRIKIKDQLPISRKTL